MMPAIRVPWPWLSCAWQPRLPTMRLWVFGRVVSSFSVKSGWVMSTPVSITATTTWRSGSSFQPSHKACIVGCGRCHCAPSVRPLSLWWPPVWVWAPVLSSRASPRAGSPTAWTLASVASRSRTCATVRPASATYSTIRQPPETRATSATVNSVPGSSRPAGGSTTVTPSTSNAGTAAQSASPGVIVAAASRRRSRSMPERVGAVNGSKAGSASARCGAATAADCDHSDTPKALRARTANHHPATSCGRPPNAADEPSKATLTPPRGSSSDNSPQPSALRNINS